jgi:hypothetical protein
MWLALFFFIPAAGSRLALFFFIPAAGSRLALFYFDARPLFQGLKILIL